MKLGSREDKFEKPLIVSPTPTVVSLTPIIVFGTPRNLFSKKVCRGQAWGFDLMIAATLFMASIIIFYVYSLNYPTEGQETLNALFYEGDFIAESLLSEGFPDDWTADLNNVVKIGILNNKKVNKTKLETLYNWVDGTGYAQTRVIFNTKYDYFFNFSEQIIIDDIPIDGIGLPFQGQNPQNLIKITRLTIYQNKPVTLNVYIWE